MYINVGSSGDALNLSNLLKDGDWMVLYYADWCGHCQTMKPEWHKVVNKMKKNNNVNIAEIESNHIDNLIAKPKIQGFPTIKMYNNGKEVANFEDERVADKMENFAMTNINKIKPLKQYNQRPNTKHVGFPPIQLPKIKSRTIKTKTVKSKTVKPKTVKPKTVKPKTVKPKTVKLKTVKPKTIKRKTTKSKTNYDLKKSTKSVFSKLINSFDRIGKEAKKDAELLKEAKHLL